VIRSRFEPEAVARSWRHGLDEPSGRHPVPPDRAIDSLVPAGERVSTAVFGDGLGDGPVQSCRLSEVAEPPGATLDRHQVWEAAPTEHAVGGVGPTTIVVASGKGGAGKSVVSVLIATIAAAQGWQVLLLEGDQNRGSLHIVLGVRPAGRLEAVVSGDASPVDLLTPVSDRLWLLPAASGAEALHGLGSLDRARLHQRLQSLSNRYDLVVVDAGTDFEGIVRVSSIGAHRLVLVVVPEPAAMIDTYAVVKLVHTRIPTLPIDVLINRAADEVEARSVFDRLATACAQCIRYQPGYLGTLPDDEDIRAALRISGGLVRHAEGTKTLRELRKILEGKLTIGGRPVTHGSVIR